MNYSDRGFYWDKFLNSIDWLFMRMNKGSRRFYSVLTISLALLMVSAHYSSPVHGSTITPTIGIWSETYASPIVSDPSLTSGSSITVDLNVTNAPVFNGYDLTLFYDPTYLTPSFVDVRNGVAFSNPFVGVDDVSLDRIHLAVVNLGAPFAGGAGVLARINFTVVGVGVSPLTLASPTTHPSIWAQTWTQMVMGYNEIPTQTSDGYFSNVPGNPGPVAGFTFSPTSPIEGDTIVFDASSSFDPDSPGGPSHGIASYIWEFDDGITEVTTFPTDAHRFATIISFGSLGDFYGNFSVRLTVVDSDQHYEGMITHRVDVGQITPPTKDFTLWTNRLPRSVTPGLSMTYAVVLTPLGGFTGPVGLKARVAPSIVNGPTVSLVNKMNIKGTSQVTVVLTVNTSSLTPPGQYSIVVTTSRAQLTHYDLVYLTIFPSQ